MNGYCNIIYNQVDTTVAQKFVKHGCDQQVSMIELMSSPKDLVENKHLTR